MPKHYLLSLSMSEYGGTMHGYLMSNDKEDIRRASAKLLDVAEKNIGELRAPMILATPLSASDVKKVRKLIVGRGEAAGALLRDAKDFHVSIWAMANSDPENARLLKLH